MQSRKSQLVGSVISASILTFYVSASEAQDQMGMAALAVATYEASKDQCHYEDVVGRALSEVDKTFARTQPSAWRVAKRGASESPNMLRNMGRALGGESDCQTLGMGVWGGLVPGLVIVGFDPTLIQEMNRLEKGGGRSKLEPPGKKLAREEPPRNPIIWSIPTFVNGQSASNSACQVGAECRLHEPSIVCPFEDAERVAKSDEEAARRLGGTLVGNGRCEVVPISKPFHTEPTGSVHVVYATEQGRHYGYIPAKVITAAPSPSTPLGTTRRSAPEVMNGLQSREGATSSNEIRRRGESQPPHVEGTSDARRLNQTQRDQLVGVLQEQLHRCWVVPSALQSAPKPPVPFVRMTLNQDGSLAGDPAVVNRTSEPLFEVAADSAVRAALRCAPLRIPAQFKPYYEEWKDLVVNFNLRDLP